MSVVSERRPRASDFELRGEHRGERSQAAIKQSRQRQVEANKEKLVADEEYRKEHEGH